MDTKFKSDSTFDVNMSSSSNSNFDVNTESGKEIKVKPNNGPVIIPIKTSKDMRMKIDSESGTYLKYIIDNETGNYIILEDNVLKLYSKTNKLLSATTIPRELPKHDGFTNRYLYIDSNGNICWEKGGAGGGETYYSGAAISISKDNNINLVYDTKTLFVNDKNQLEVDVDKVLGKLKEGDNVIIKDNIISAKDTKYTAGKNIIIDENDNNKISVSDDLQDYTFLDNKPSINGVTLMGALFGKDLNLDVVEYMSYSEYRHLETKERKLYFVCKNAKDVQAENCWRIYLQNKLMGEWEVESGMVTLPKFPMRFPFRFA